MVDWGLGMTNHMEDPAEDLSKLLGRLYKEPLTDNWYYEVQPGTSYQLHQYDTGKWQVGWSMSPFGNTPYEAVAYFDAWRVTAGLLAIDRE